MTVRLPSRYRLWQVAADAGLVALASGSVAAGCAWLIVGATEGWSRPVLDGFLISGGASLTPEFLALWLGLALFTSASIAEIALRPPRNSSRMRS